MLTELDGGYDVGYRAVTGFWGTAPSSLVVRYLATHDVAGLKVLDAGAGEGKNAAASLDPARSLMRSSVRTSPSRMVTNFTQTRLSTGYRLILRSSISA